MSYTRPSYQFGRSSTRPLPHTRTSHRTIRTPSHQLTNDGRPLRGTRPTPCFSLAHANFWADALCSKFTALAPTHETSIHKHYPNTAYPTYKYTLTLGEKVIDTNTTETIRDRYYQHLRTGFGRRKVAGWLTRFIHMVYKPKAVDDTGLHI